MPARPPARLLPVVLALLSPPVWAVEHCALGDKPINLNNGNTTEGITGTVRCIDQDTKQESHTVAFRDGKQHGWEVRRWADGRVIEQEYRDGKRHGGFKRSEEGRLVETSHYVDDREQGESLYFHPNGKVSRRVERALEDGQSTYANYDEQGRLTEAGCGLQSSRMAGLETCVWKGPSPLVFFHSNGQKSAVIALKSGLREGMTEFFDEQGQPEGSTRYAGGKRDGVSTVLRAGVPQRTTTYAKGEKEGAETEFFKDGRKKQVTVWKDHEEVKVVEYFQNGERKREFSVDGPRGVETLFDDVGQPRSRAELVRERWRGWIPMGVSESFLGDGGLEAREHYTQGQLEGRRQEWSESGVLLEDSQWTKGRVTARKRWETDGGLVEDETFEEDGSRKKKPPPAP